MSQAKRFRIEVMMGYDAPVVEDVAAAAPAAAPAPVVAVSPSPDLTAAAPIDPDAENTVLSIEELAALRDRVSEAAKLQTELAALSSAIEKPTQELSALHYDGPSAARFQEAGSELDAVVNATEQATDTILTASEKIDSAAAHLGSTAVDDASRNQAEDIAEQVVNIFEACNFQDITGQRITKVVQALQFIDERVAKMMDIWGGANDLAAFAPEPEEAEGDEALLNGPALEEHHGHASQDDIDALFA
ncbi:MAG: protein phosphatase CheZ [Candidatus Phaeomarinobacter sp.]